MNTSYHKKSGHISKEQTTQKSGNFDRVDFVEGVRKNLIYKKIGIFCTLFVFSLAVFLLWLIQSIDNHVERTSGPISNEVYVWQRQWDSAVSEALREAAPETAGFAVLTAEVSFKQGLIDQIVRVLINYEILKKTGKKVALALRIGPYLGPFDEDSETTILLSKLAGSLIEDACAGGIEPSELQIDFDCAESKLAGYQNWVRVLRREIEPVPIVITALPSWLKRKTFHALAHEADGFVLQVHSLERPKGPNVPMMLCDNASSVKWVEKAAWFGVPFRVALPTYGYVVGFDRNGQFLGLTAEGPSRSWPDGASLRVVCSDAVAIAKLVRTWQSDRPANMSGLIWYRLPVETDQLNWQWQTLSMVMDGRAPREEIKAKVEYPQSGIAEITLVNTGQRDYSPNVRVGIECGHGKILAADGMSGFVFKHDNPTDIEFIFDNEQSLIKIRPGEQWKIGWIRFDGKAEVRAYASKIQ